MVARHRGYDGWAASISATSSPHSGEQPNLLTVYCGRGQAGRTSLTWTPRPSSPPIALRVAIPAANQMEALDLAHRSLLATADHPAAAAPKRSVVGAGGIQHAASGV